MKKLFLNIILSTLLCGCVPVDNKQDNVTVAACTNYNDASMVISFTWDDGLVSHWETIAPLFVRHNYRATFFVTTYFFTDTKRSKTYSDGYKQIISYDMEVGSHTWQHMNLTLLDDLDAVRVQLSKSKEHIKYYLDYNAISFCHPNNSHSIEVDKIVDEYYLNSRFSSTQYTDDRYVFTIMSGQTCQTLINQYKNAVSQKKNWLIFAGHGVDDNGYSPIQSEELDKFLSFINYAESSDNLWIDTFGNISKYMYLRDHVSFSIDKTLRCITIDTSSAMDRFNALDIRPEKLSIKIFKPDYEHTNMHIKGDCIINCTDKSTYYLVNIDLSKGNTIFY